MAMKEALIADLTAKLELLKFIANKTEALIREENKEALQRQLKAIKNAQDQCEHAKLQVESKMFAEKEPKDEISQWSAGVDAILAESDSKTATIVQWFDVKKQQQKQAEREQRQAERNEENEYQIHLEKELQKLRLENLQAVKVMKAQVQLAESHQVVPESNTPAQSKLPKIDIQKFDGVKTDWPRFWGQFVENVDKNNWRKLTNLHIYNRILRQRLV